MFDVRTQVSMDLVSRHEACLYLREGEIWLDTIYVQTWWEYDK